MGSPQESRVYDARWRKVRLKILERDSWLCQIRLPGCEVDASQVDHVVPWRAGGPFYDPANLRAACGYCNRSRAKREGVGAVKRRPSREW